MDIYWGDTMLVISWPVAIGLVSIVAAVLVGATLAIRWFADALGARLFRAP